MKPGLAILLGLLWGNLLFMLLGVALGNARGATLGSAQAVLALLGLLVYSRLYWGDRRRRCWCLDRCLCPYGPRKDLL